MNSDQDPPQRPNGNDPSDSVPSDSELTPNESVAMDALLNESVGGKTPPDLKDSILQQYHLDPSDGDAIKVAVTPVSRSHRHSARRRKSYRNWAIVSGLAVAGSLAALIWTRPDNADGEGISLAKSQVVEKSDQAVVVADSEHADGRIDEESSPNKLARSPIVLNAPSDQNRDADGKTQEKQERRLRTPSAAVKLVSKTIESDFRNYWKSAGVKPTAKANASDVAKRLSVALGVTVPPQILSNHDTVVDWLSDKKVGLAIARTWWGQVTDGNFRTLPRDAQKRLQTGFASQLESTQYFDQYLVGLIGRTNRASNDFYASMIPADSDATHPDMIANLASLTMNVDVNCTRCHDSMIGSSHGQLDYWGFAATIDCGLKTVDDKLVRVADKPAKAIFFETMDRRGRVAQPRIPGRWLVFDSSDSTSDLKIESISDWSVSLMGSPALASGVVNSLWKLVHGRPLSGPAAHPMSAPMSDELLKVQQDLVDDLVNSDFNIRRTLALILMSPTTRRSTPESLRDVWATDQSDAHQKAIAFAGALPASKPIPMAVKVDQSMRAIGSMLSIDGRNLLAQIGEAGKSSSKIRSSEPLAWDFPDQAEGPPVQWLQTVREVDSKIEHLCYLGGLVQVPAPIRNAASAMQNAGVDEPTMLHRVWWMVQGQ